MGLQPIVDATGSLLVEFDSDAPAVVVGGRRTALDHRTARVFALLAERLGERVSKDELLGCGWPDQIVHENSLAKAMSKLRGAIVGSGLEIVASYGVGYILRATDHASNAPCPPPVVTPALAGWRWRTLVGGLFGAMLVTSVGGYLLARDGETPTRTTLPVTHDGTDAITTILWVDDHPANNRLEVTEFTKRRIAVHLAESTDDALKLLAMNRYRLVVSDLGRGEDRLAGLKMIGAMRDRGLIAPVLIYTVRPKDAAGQSAQHRLVTQAGAADLAVTPQEVRAKVLGRLGL